MKIDTPLFKIEIEWLVIITIIISIFSLNIRNYLSNFFICYIFILFHEMSHMLFGAIFGREIEKIKFTISGVSVLFKEDILGCNISRIKKLIIYFAGPFANFFMAFIFKDRIMLFEINIFLGCLNLIPIYPLDGYNVLCIFLYDFKNKKNILKTMCRIVFFLLLIISIIQVMLYKTISFLVFTIYLIFISKIRKKSYFSC